MSDNECPDEYLDENGNPCEAEPEQKRGELKPCPFCGTLPQANAWIFRGISETRYFCPNQECPLSVRTVTLEEWNTRPIEDALEKRIAQLEAELDRRDEQIAELTATKHSQAFRNAELSRFVWWVYQVYARNVQELTSGITEACTYETEEKAEKGKYGLPIRCWKYIRYLEEYTAGIYNGAYLDSETSTGVKDPPAGHWKSQACIATKRMLELTAFLRKIILLGLLRGSPRLRDEALRILDGLEPSPPDVSTTQDILTPVKTSQSNENTNHDYYKHDAVSWISIANGRLPEKFQECIVLDKNKRVHNWIHDDALLPLFAEYTHWMPLPNPPEVEK